MMELDVQIFSQPNHDEGYIRCALKKTRIKIPLRLTSPVPQTEWP